jgi:dimethylargininase
MQFTQAIVRKPSENFADGLTTVDLGAPVFDKAMVQHTRYCEALERCGLTLTVLDADERYPDSCFVEDVAVIAGNCCILTRPGAQRRAGEVVSLQPTLAQFFQVLPTIKVPGTLDGGDVCEAATHCFIGISDRTNEAGASQLADFLSRLGFTSSCVDIRGMIGILHLKSGVAYLGDNTLVIIDALAQHPAFRGYRLIRVAAEEDYAANCVRVNDYLLIAAGFPKLQASMTAEGYRVLPLEMSEFQKMDGGLSCLSLRF